MQIQFKGEALGKSSQVSSGRDLLSTMLNDIAKFDDNLFFIFFWSWLGVHLNIPICVLNDFLHVRLSGTYRHDLRFNIPVFLYYYRSTIFL